MHVVGFSGGLEGTKPAIQPDFMDLRMSPEDQPWHPSLLYWRIAVQKYNKAERASQCATRTKQQRLNRCVLPVDTLCLYHPSSAPTPSQGLCSFLLTALHIPCVPGEFDVHAGLLCWQAFCIWQLVGSFRGGVQCLICEWCWFAVVCVDCSCSLFWCVSAFLGIQMHKLAF